MLDELIRRTHELNIRNLDNQLDDYLEEGRNRVLIKILKRYKGKKLKSLPPIVQEELKEFKNRIDSMKITQVDLTSPYVQPSSGTNTNEQQTNISNKKTTKFESITIDDLLKDYEETTQEIKKHSYKKLFGTILISLIPLIMMLSPYLKKPIKLTTIYFKNLFYLLFSIIIIFYCNKTYPKTPEQMIQESIAQYPGKCPCPYSIMSNGKKCGKRSAYSKPGGYEPLCYVSDITGDKENDAKTQAQIRIVDGDTIHINKVKYRLHGIDAPEINQECKINKKNYKCGVKSKEFLVSLIGNQSVKCNHKDIDRYKRVVAECFVGKTNLNKELVRNGWALAYIDYSKDYVIDQKFAEDNKLGIWKGTFMEPKKWRRLN